MKEIIYVQAGSYANHIGTHFWNTQESYLNALSHSSLPEASDTIAIDSQVAFRRSEQQRETLTPRAVIFDHKEKFGNITSVLAQSADLEALEADSASALWAGQTAEIRQPSVGQSGYHDQLDDAENMPAGHASATNTAIDAPHSAAASSRYWTDFSRVYFAPKSFQRVPDIPSWDIGSHDWNAGSELYSRYDAEENVMEETVRMFVEECDSLQGLQLMHDTATFGPFIDSFLAAFREEYSRLTIFSLPILSSPRVFDVDDTRRLRRVINDAMVLRNLNEVSSMNVPLFVPNEEINTAAMHSLQHFDAKKPYYTSALVSSHVESVTLPTRLQSGGIDLSEIGNQLNWHGDTRFAHLAGTSPTQEDVFSHDIELDFSSSPSLSSAGKGSVFARLDITRGLTSRGIAAYDQYAAQLSIREPLRRSVHLRPYPLPSSFPKLVNHPGSLSKATAMHSSLFTTGKTAGIIKEYARLADDAARRNIDLGSMERDEVKELAADLWTLHEAFLDQEDTVES